MVIGFGVRHTDGPGLVTSRGVGRRITMDAGSITTTIGRGVRAAATTELTVGGDQRSWLLSTLTTTTAGTHSATTSAIHIRVITTSRDVLLRSGPMSWLNYVA